MLAGTATEGRDSPSLGLDRAAAYIAERFAEYGLDYAPDSVAAYRRLRGESPPGVGEGAGEAEAEQGRTQAGGGTYLRPFQHETVGPDADGCRLSYTVDGETHELRLGEDFLPVAGCGGEASGELVFLGFGIEAKEERYDDLKGRKLRGQIAVILSGEPRHSKRFEGEEVTEAASLWNKLKALRRLGAEAVLVVRRPPAELLGPKGEDALPPFGFRHTWAFFLGSRPTRTPADLPPTLELTPEAASKLLGTDVLKVAERIDRSVKPVKVRVPEIEVELASATESQPAKIDNVVGVLKGADPALAEEYVVVGAHYDHLGVGPRGRIGFGADDNASGTTGLLEVAEALAAARPRRSVIFCAFAGEEDGLLGSKAFAAELPVNRSQVVAMVNMDMIGRGDEKEVAVLGIRQNPDLERILNRAKGLERTGVSKIVVRQGEELFQRSDHYSFHEIGVPVLFFFEGLPISRNKDYHTWRDTLEHVDTDKVTRTTKLVFNTVWLLANDDERPPAPQN